MNAVGFRFRVSLFILDFVGFHGKFLRLMDRCFFFFFSPFFRETGANGLVLRESRRISSVQITNAMRLPSVPLHLGRNINRRVTYFAPWYFTGWITSVHRGGKKKKKTKEKKEKKNRKPTVLTDSPVILFPRAWNCKIMKSSEICAFAFRAYVFIMDSNSPIWTDIQGVSKRFCKWKSKRL